MFLSSQSTKLTVSLSVKEVIEPVWHTFSMVISALSTKHFEEDILKQKRTQKQIVIKFVLVLKKLKNLLIFNLGWKLSPFLG